MFIAAAKHTCIVFIDGGRQRSVRIDSTGKARLAVFGPCLLRMDPRFIMVSAIDTLGPGHGVILDGWIVFPFLWI